jgi:hypothetical protein
MNGKREGQGKMIYPNDRSYNQYKGDWHNDKWHGKGILIVSDGSRYEGEFKNGDRHGIGK